MVNNNSNQWLITDDKALMSEWNYRRNNADGISPERISVGSHKQVWWICSKCDYEWRSAVNKRAVERHKCPACVGQALHKGFNDLATKCPELVSEWDEKKNGCKSSDVISGSGKMAWWRCKRCGYEWEAKIRDRARGHGCPACVNQVVWKGHNDLATVFPDIAAEWDKEKNKIGADEVVFGSAKKAWWKCSKCGHQWNAVIVSRTANGNGCPKCANRFQTSFQEQALFYYLSRYFDDAENKFVGALGDGTELDIYIPSLGVGIEYDGQNWHSGKQALALEQKKYQNCKLAGITLYRVREARTEKNTCDAFILCDYKRGGYDALTKAIQQLLSILRAEQDVDVVRDAEAIRKQYYGYLEKNSLAQLFPEIVKEWNSKMNGSITPSMVFAKTGEKFWWKCKKCGYDWEMRVTDRTSKRRRGCPVCANKVVWEGHNDLATKCPELCDEWDYKKNEVQPSQVLYVSSKTFWWKCKKCGYNWEASPNHRSRGGNCPVCTGRTIWQGHNDLATMHPQLLSDWDYVENNKHDLRPTEITSGSRQLAAWVCPEGHHWNAIVYSRTKSEAPTGCPVCAGQKTLAGYNDLQSRFPKIAMEWDYEKNDGVEPSEIAAFSSKKVAWVCPKGHRWEATVVSRTRKGDGCPYCSNHRVLTGENDLQTVRPDIASEWHPTKNGSLKPSEVSQFSNRKVWWLCPLGHDYQMAVSARTSKDKGCGCYYCSGRRTLAGFNDLETRFPEVAKKWHPTKNGSLKPNAVAPYSTKKVWWVDDDGKEYERRIDAETASYRNKQVRHNSK